MKKIIITITILSLLNMIGCYYQEQMTPSNYNFDENEELMITTKDAVYNLNSNEYYFENDTLFFTVKTKIDKQSTLKTNLEIPVDEIEKVEVERTDAFATTITVFGSIVGVLVIIILIGGLVQYNSN